MVCNFINLAVETAMLSQNIAHHTSRVITVCPRTETIPHARTDIVVALIAKVISKACPFHFTVTFIHASMRLRNVKNKLVNKMEVIGLKRTPMGLFLEALGMEQELLS